MRLVEELLKQNIDREDMTPEELKAFINYWFDKYEQEGFSKVFCSPYNGEEEYNGKNYKVIDRASNIDEDPINGAELSCQPLWNIQFDDGTTMAAYPEEIIPSEIRDNMWRTSDKKYLSML